MSAALTRRRLLALLAAAGLGIAGVRALDEDEPSREERFASVLGDRDAARSVGTRYLDTHPDERDVRTLLGRLARLGDPSLVSEDLLRDRLRRAVRRDFAAGRVAQVDGWYLSETEARLCALSTFT